MPVMTVNMTSENITWYHVSNTNKNIVYVVGTVGGSIAPLCWFPPTINWKK